jgi:hypothetical protein
MSCVAYYILRYIFFQADILNRRITYQIKVTGYSSYGKSTRLYSTSGTFRKAILWYLCLDYGIFKHPDPFHKVRYVLVFLDADFDREFLLSFIPYHSKSACAYVFNVADTERNSNERSVLDSQVRVGDFVHFSSSTVTKSSRNMTPYLALAFASVSHPVIIACDDNQRRISIPWATGANIQKRSHSSLPL